MSGTTPGAWPPGMYDSTFVSYGVVPTDYTPELAPSPRLPDFAPESSDWLKTIERAAAIREAAAARARTTRAGRVDWSCVDPAEPLSGPCDEIPGEAEAAGAEGDGDVCVAPDLD